MTPETIASGLAAFCFGYPFVMAWYWMAGGLLFRILRERGEPTPDQPPPLADAPPISILVPCRNEADQLDETLAALFRIRYPGFEVVAIDDASTDATGAILDAWAAREPRLRVLHLAENQGKATALNTATLFARHEILVCIDGDAMLDPHALTWFARRFASDVAIGGIAGNPRIRNRGSLLGRLQVGEFSAIVGLIKRAQTMYGRLFTVSGAICAFRKRALADAGFWSAQTVTDDLDVTWRLQLSGWRVVFEPRALCWILMPETLRGLWRQRLRWAQGGAELILTYGWRVLSPRHARLWPVFLNNIASIVWCYTIIFATLAWCLFAIGMPHPAWLPALDPIPGWWGLLLALTYFLQAALSVRLERSFERGMAGYLFSMIWYPLAFWLLQVGTTAVGFLRALLGERRRRGVWVSPDRGMR